MSYKEFSCLKDSSAPVCKQKNVTFEGSREINVCFSYKYLCNNRNSDCTRKVYVRRNVYDRLKNNFTILDHSDFEELLEVAREIVKILPRDQWNNLLIKLSTFIKMRGINIDIFQGIVLKDGLVFMHDNTYSNIDYVKYAMRY